MGCVTSLASLILWPLRWRRYVPSKRRLTFNRLHSVIAEKIGLLCPKAISYSAVPEIPWFDRRSVFSTVLTKAFFWIKVFFISELWYVVLQNYTSRCRHVATGSVSNGSLTHARDDKYMAWAQLTGVPSSSRLSAGNNTAVDWNKHRLHSPLSCPYCSLPTCADIIKWWTTGGLHSRQRTRVFLFVKTALPALLLSNGYLAEGRRTYHTIPMLESR
jgi:hypothetical protein